MTPAICVSSLEARGQNPELLLVGRAERGFGEGAPGVMRKAMPDEAREAAEVFERDGREGELSHGAGRRRS